MKKVEKQIEKEEPSIWSFFRSLPTKSFEVKKSLKVLSIAFVLLFTSVSGFAPGGDVLTSSAQEITISKEERYVNSVKTRAQNELIKEVEDYISTMAPNSELSSRMVVEVCQEYDLDIIFVLAQAQLESHFGTKGTAARTNSVWNVGSYTDGTIIYWYDHPNESIEPYAKLLHEKYLMKSDTCNINDKEILHLIQDRGYVNYMGKRFADAKRYEPILRNIMIQIDMKTSIALHQGIIRMDDSQLLAYFTPPDEEIDYTTLQAMK
jgi:hypothetical protein